MPVPIPMPTPTPMKNAARTSSTSSPAAAAASKDAAADRAIALVETEMRAVEQRLAERMESPIGAIPQVGAHLLGAGGKRLRPLLSVLAARAAGVSVDF